MTTTGSAGPTATTRQGGDGRGAVRVEDVYDTHVDDLWAACTTPERLARWIARVSGDLRVGGRVQAVFTSTWSGELVVEVCERPHHLLLTSAPGPEQTEIELWLTAEGPRTRLVVEERGVPAGAVAPYAAGWQVHLEDLATCLVTGAAVHPGGWSESVVAAGWQERWAGLLPTARADVADSGIGDVGAG